MGKFFKYVSIIFHHFLAKPPSKGSRVNPPTGFEPQAFLGHKFPLLPVAQACASAGVEEATCTFVEMSHSEAPGLATPAKAHLVSVNNIRALAAVSVMLFHVICVEDYLEEMARVKPFFSLGQYGVQLFFIISGFIIPYSLYYASYKIQNYGQFILKRLIRLDPPYLVNVLLMVGMIKGLQVFFNSPLQMSGKQIMLHIGYLNAFFGEPWLNTVYWSLSVEFQYYLFMGLVFPVLLLGPWWRRGILLVMACFCIVFQGLSHDFFFVHTPLFCMGILAFFLFIKKITNSEFFIGLGLAFVFILYQMGAIIGLVSLFGVLLLFTFKVRSKVLTFLGTISYSLYLIHPFVGNFIASFIKKRSDVLSIELLGAFLSVCISLASAYALFILIEKPSQRWSSRIRYS